jgi:hypothetical protein
VNYTAEGKRVKAVETYRTEKLLYLFHGVVDRGMTFTIVGMFVDAEFTWEAVVKDRDRP